jgi:hypothetical protein
LVDQKNKRSAELLPNKNFSKGGPSNDKPYNMDDEFVPNHQSKFSPRNGWGAIEAFSQILYTIRKDQEKKDKVKKRDLIRSSLDEQMREIHSKRLQAYEEKQQQATKIQEIISKDKKNEQRERQKKKNNMAKEKTFIDDQVNLEQNRKFELHEQMREAEKKIILKVKSELENEKTLKLQQKQKQK